MDVNASARQQAVAPRDTPIVASINGPLLRVGTVGGPAPGPGPTPGISESKTAPQAPAPEVAQTVPVSAEKMAADAAVDAIRAVVVFQTERDHPRTSGQQQEDAHAQKVELLRKSALHATRMNLYGQQKNSEICGLKLQVAQETLEAVECKSNSANRIASARAEVDVALAVYRRSLQAVYQAEQLQRVDTVNVNELLKSSAE